MKLKLLQIERETWGENKGKYVGKIEYEGESGSVHTILAPDISNTLLSFIGPVITQFATAAAKEIEANLVESVSAASQQPLIDT